MKASVKKINSLIKKDISNFNKTQTLERKIDNESNLKKRALLEKRIAVLNEESYKIYLAIKEVVKQNNINKEIWSESIANEYEFLFEDFID